MVALSLTTFHGRPSTIATIVFNEHGIQSLQILSSVHIFAA